MVQITCDNCGKQKVLGATDGWILGFDLEVESPSVLQRSIRFLDRWDDRRALELGAIQLCSEECKSEYVNAARAA
jgi:hypothetical protein